MRPTIPRIYLTFVFVLCFLIQYNEIFSQPRLILSRIGNKNRITFYEGDVIKLKVKGGDNYFSAPIVGLRDSVIHFKLYDIDLDSISEINIEGRRFGGFNTGQYGAAVMVASPLYLGIDALNQGEVVTRTYIQAASIFGFGYILYALRRKNFKVKGRNKIFIIK